MGIRWITLDRVSSTNTYVAGLLKQEKVREELVVTANYQETGKGQGSSTWYSEPGRNLLMSVLLFPVFLSASMQFYLSRAVSLALCDFIRSRDIPPRIKWPNDILISGGKIAGILIENGVTGQSLSHSIVGIGLNLNQTIYPPFDVPATSMVLETGRTEVPRKTAEQLYGHLRLRMDQLEQGEYGPLEKEYLELLYRIHEVSSFIEGDRTFRGIIRGVNPYGELLVEEGGTTRAFGFREIRFSV
ncbi:MAG: biotin--[acetyl-CoA-carboxylase] ligase [Bacteroidales bacterium]